MLADEPTFLTPSEVTQALNDEGIEVSLTSVQRWLRNGRLRSIKLPSGHRRVRREDVAAILTGDHTAAGAA
jgi:excisionase family DNA binding protein